MKDTITISITQDSDYPLLVENSRGSETLLDRDGSGKMIKIASKCLGESVESVCLGLANGESIVIEDKHGRLGDMGGRRSNSDSHNHPCACKPLGGLS